ncbi:MAG: aminopeptidase P family protein [Chloroflexi bacterium]|nr:aminopeptidase P family protein [Chloroflexota bacterium]
MNSRLSRLVKITQENNLDAVALNPGQTLTWLTGLQFHLMERPVLGLFAADGSVRLVLPNLERAKLQGLNFEPVVAGYGDDPSKWDEVFMEGFAGLDGKELKIGVEPARLRVLELGFLQRALPQAAVVDASKALAKLRICKDEQEIAQMRQAAVIAQNALLETLKTIEAGQTEKQIAGELMVQLFRAGSDAELPFAPIVAIGENSANPHAAPGDRVLREGDILLIDYGASFEGYYSDITRSFFCGEVEEEFKTIAELVHDANQAARLGGKPGMRAGEIDDLARNVIAAAGYGEAFFHRVGHGLGMETHEEPYMFAANPLLLEEGMVFTIEPGIYLTGRGGIRIEDDVVVTKDGLLSLTDLPRRVLPISMFKG